MEIRLTLLMILGLVTSLYSQHLKESEQAIGGVDIVVPFTTDILVIDGKPTIHYEVRVSNLSKDSIQLEMLEVLNTSDSSVVFVLAKNELRHRLGAAERKDKRSTIAPGASSIIYVDFSLPDQRQNMGLKHRVGLRKLSTAETEKKFSIHGAVVQPRQKTQIVLGPPLSSGPWVAVYDPSWERGHRRVVYTVDGKARIPGRFAIDFIKVDNKGKYARGEDNVVKNWYGYGVDVLAVADGVVSSVRDDFQESQTLALHPRYPADKATGNYISIDVGNNSFAFYEHLKPGSIKVKPGQKIKKGDIIGSLGFTGQTTGPHLHFHVANKDSALGAEGISFAFESFNVLGTYPDFEKFGKEKWLPVKDASQSTKNQERPAPNSVISF